MVILRCDKCGKEVAWYATNGLPRDWIGQDGKELCPDCAGGYRQLEAELEKELQTQLDKYCNRLNLKCQVG